MSEQESYDPGRHAYSVSLPSFEGPLDLLLHLCQKHELDILEIPVGFVTEKYLEYLALMKTLNLDLAAEYLLMAATLIHIKSKMLLPQVPKDQEDDSVPEEEEDPREALIRRLLEYQKYKKAGAELTELGLRRNEVFLRGAAMETTVPEGPAPLARVPIFSLLDAFQRVIEKSKVKFTHDIVTDRISLTDRIHEIVDFLRDKQRVNFEDLFSEAKHRFDLVITFLALLEMGKLRMTILSQDENYGPLFVALAGNDVTADELPRYMPNVEATGADVPTLPLAEDAGNPAENRAEGEVAAANDSANDTGPQTSAERVDYADLSAQAGEVFETVPNKPVQPASESPATVLARAKANAFLEAFGDGDDELPDELRDALAAADQVMARKPGMPRVVFPTRKRVQSTDEAAAAPLAEPLAIADAKAEPTARTTVETEGDAAPDAAAAGEAPQPAHAAEPAPEHAEIAASAELATAPEAAPALPHDEFADDDELEIPEGFVFGEQGPDAERGEYAEFEQRLADAALRTPNRARDDGENAPASADLADLTPDDDPLEAWLAQAESRASEAPNPAPETFEDKPFEDTQLTESAAQDEDSGAETTTHNSSDAGEAAVSPTEQTPSDDGQAQ